MIRSLVVESLKAGYGGSLIVDDVTFRVGENDSLAVLGPNGSGKSTVARAVLGLCQTYEGSVLWDDQQLIDRATWKRVRMGLGYVPQVANVFPSLTVQENLLMGAVGQNAPEQRQSLADVYDLFPGLADRLRVAAGHLSGGERRMLSFATAIVSRPRLLILDEPTSDLAPAAIDTVFDRIRTIQDELSIPILLVEQNVAMALELAKRYCVLVRGKIRHESKTVNASMDEIAGMFLERD